MIRLTVRTLPTSTNMLERMHWAVKRRMRRGFAWELRAALADIDLTPAPLIESPRPGKRRVSITIYRPRRLDPDNCAGGLKPLLDAMRDVGLIRNDSPRWLELVVDQRIEKVDCRTEITLEEMA